MSIANYIGQKTRQWLSGNNASTGTAALGSLFEAEFERIYGNTDAIVAAIDAMALLLKNGITDTPAWNETDKAASARATLAKIVEYRDALVGGAPGALDVLNELAAAIGNDPNFATTMTNALAARVLKAGDTMTGPLVLPGNAVTALQAVPLQQIYTQAQLQSFFEGIANNKFEVDWARILNVLVQTAQIADGAVTQAKLANSIRGLRPYQVIWTPELISLSSADPFFDLTSATQDLDSSHFPDLVPKMQAKYARVNVSGTWYSSYVVGSSYSGNGAVVVMAVSNNAQNQALLKGMAEALAYGISGVGVISFPAAVGNIPAGDYAITAVDSAGMTISFACTVTTGSPNGQSFAIYPFRIVGQATKARHFQLTELGFMVGGGRIVDGYPARDQFQGHRMLRNTSGITEGIWANISTGSAGSTPPWTLYNTDTTTGDPTTDGTNGTPRKGAKTEGPAFGLNAYYYVGTYTP